jgi:hypothetical protein
VPSRSRSQDSRIGLIGRLRTATGGILSVKDGTHSAKLAVLGNYIATSFVTAADGHGGTLIGEGSQTANQIVPLTAPHRG